MMFYHVCPLHPKHTYTHTDQVDLLKEALKSCEDVLQRDPNNVKALFRAGKVGGEERERDFN